VGAEGVRCQRLPPVAPSRYENPFIELAARSVPLLEKLYRADTPDLLIYDGLFFAGRIIAKRLHLRVIQSTPCLDTDNLLDYGEQSADGSEFMKFLCEQNCAESYFSSGPAPYRDEQNLFLFPRSFQLNSDAFDESCFYAGRVGGEQMSEGSWPLARADRRPVVLLAMSSTYRQKPSYFRLFIDALTGLGWHIVISIGEENDAGYFDPLPDHFETIQNMSHNLVLRHADLLIFMGGMLATAEAAYHGVPSICIRNDEYPELIRYGNISLSLGISKCVSLGPGFAARLRETATQIIEDPTIRKRVKEVQREVRREAGAEETANRIEDYLLATSPGFE
jgi:MGT family glycosyltransferase